MLQNNLAAECAKQIEKDALDFSPHVDGEVTFDKAKAVQLIQAALDQHAESRCAELRECLQWYVDEDETNSGDRWDEVNAYWLEGKARAVKALAAHPAKQGVG